MAQLIWSWAVHVPVPVSNMVLRTLIPEETMGSDKAIITRVKDKYQLKDYDVDLYGGISEGVNFPCTFQVKTNTPFHDEDCNVLLINKFINVGPGQTAAAELEEIDGGLARVRVKDPSSVHPSLTTTEGSVTYLRSDVFRHNILDVKSGASIPFPERDMQDAWHRNVKTPAWTHTCALRCEQWPKAASKWDTRKRPHGFPRKEFIQELQSSGCFLIPQVPTAGDREEAVCTTWRFSFANVERKLMNSLSQLQKHIFVLFKIICFQKLCSPLIIEVHHLRALFLHACEQVPVAMWRPDQLTQLLIFNIDRLLYALIDNIIPGYIDTDINLVKGQATDFLDEMQILICDMKLKCMDVVLEFCQTFPFEATPKWLDRSVLQPVQDVIDNAILPANIFDCMCKVILPFLIRFAIAYVEPNTDISDDQVVGVLQAYHNLFSQFAKQVGIQLNVDSVWYITLQILSNDLLWQIRVHEYLIKYTDYQNKTSLRSNLACHYHTLFCQGRDECKIKAKEMFESCIPEMKAANKMDYVVFLSKIEDWENMKDILCELIQTAESTEGNAYSKEELITLETSVQDLGCALGDLGFVPVGSHAYYMLLTYYIRFNKEEMIDTTLALFTERYESGDIISQALLGLALEKAGKYKEAFTIYKDSQHNAKDPFRKWANRKQGMCLNLLCLQWEEEGKDVDKEKRKLELQNGVGEDSETTITNTAAQATNGFSPGCIISNVPQVLKDLKEGAEEASLQQANTTPLPGRKLSDEVTQESNVDACTKSKPSDSATLDVDNLVIRVTAATSQAMPDATLTSSIGPEDIATRSTTKEGAADLDEETQLQMAISMSMQSTSPSETNSVTSGGAMSAPLMPEDSATKSTIKALDDDMDEEAQLQLAIAMSMETE